MGHVFAHRDYMVGLAERLSVAEAEPVAAQPVELFPVSEKTQVLNLHEPLIPHLVFPKGSNLWKKLLPLPRLHTIALVVEW